MKWEKQNEVRKEEKRIEKIEIINHPINVQQF